MVPAARPDLLANALAELMADSGLRGRLVAAASSAVHQHHDIAQNVPMLADLFAQHDAGAKQ